MATSYVYQKPEDFADFWRSTLDALEAIAPEARLEYSEPHSNQQADVYRVTLQSLDHVTLRGWFAKPRHVDTAPAILIVPGYTQALYPPREWATEHGLCALALSVRGHEGSRDDSDPGFPGTLVHGIADKSTYIYRGIFCDTWRGVDILKELPGVNPTKVAVTGLSQGGALALISAAHRKVTAVAADVPFLCGIDRAVDASRVYPYEEIRNLMRTDSDRQAIQQVIRYFDVLGFASDIACPVLISVGLKDRKAPPELAQLAFEQLTGPKEWFAYEDAGHEGGGWKHDQVKVQWLKQQLAT